MNSTPSASAHTRQKYPVLESDLRRTVNSLPTATMMVSNFTQSPSWAAGMAWSCEKILYPLSIFARVAYCLRASQAMPVPSAYEIAPGLKI
jgi:hypothetical protein